MKRPRDGGGAEELIFRKNEISIGRGAKNDIPIREANCSRIHCHLVINDEGQVLVRDMGSTNGTWLRKNGELVRANSLLGVGDTVYVGGYAIELAEAPERILGSTDVAVGVGEPPPRARASG